MPGSEEYPIMFSLPDEMRERAVDFPPEYFAARGITALFLDIDNTLVPYDEPRPTHEIAAWLSSLDGAGIRLLLVSNNDEERVRIFADGLPCAYVAKAGKPLTKKYRTLAKEQGIDLAHAAALGDQIFTDVWAAHRLGIPCFVVPSIKPVETAFFCFKRAMERPFFAAYRRKHRGE